MQGTSGEQGKLNTDSDFERHVPCGDPFELLFYTAEQSHNSQMANKGYVQIFGKVNQVQIQWIDGRKQNYVHLSTINMSDMKHDL